MQARPFDRGVYPTMVTPYRADGTVDLAAVRALVRWYSAMGCDGIFAVCQSSEIHCLTLEERVAIARTVCEEAAALEAAGAPHMTIVGSGHVSDDAAEQAKELCAIAGTGVQALILISNRLDIANTSDEAWCAELDALIAALPDIPLGIYECPRPYKRLLTPAMLDHITRTGRFAFVKDTCCDAAEMARRIKQIEDTPTQGYRPLLFNANAQTLLATLQAGAAGYCGVMANFHPDLYVRLCRSWQTKPESAALLAAFLSQGAFIESLTYPAIAKYHLNKCGVAMPTHSRSCDAAAMGDYAKGCVDALERLAQHFRGQP